MRLPLTAVLSCGMAFGQQLAFTSRAYLQSPVTLSSIQGSKEFGFDSVVLRNDGPAAITAVHFAVYLKVALRAGGDPENTWEVADERRVAVSLDPRDAKRVSIGMGHVEGLKQLAKSRKETAALVVLTIEAVEFEGGGEWHQTEQKGGIPLDPALDFRVPRQPER